MNIPARTVSGIFAAALFLFVGLYAGCTVSNLFIRHEFQMVEWLCLPGYVVCIHFIHSHWRDRNSLSAVSKVTSLSSRILAVIASVCLMAGFGVGVVVIPVG